MAEFVTCADLSALKAGESKVVEVEGRTLALFNVGGTVYCLDNTCLHRGGPLGEGTLEGDIVTCPWHGWQYNVRTGESLKDPSVRVATYPVRVEGRNIQVSIGG